jgi:hypothetical protein
MRVTGVKFDINLGGWVTQLGLGAYTTNMVAVMIAALLALVQLGECHSSNVRSTLLPAHSPAQGDGSC